MTWEDFTKDSIYTHIERAKFFFACALNELNNSREKEAESCFVASLYFCRAPFEILVTRAKNNLIDTEYKKLFTDAVENIRHFKIVEAARVQDFHRAAVRFKSGGVMMGGPITIKSGSRSKDGVSFSVKADGEREIDDSGNSSVKLDRPIQVHGFSIFSEVLNELVPIPHILDQYILDMEKFVEKHNKKSQESRGQTP